MAAMGNNNTIINLLRAASLAHLLLSELDFVHFLLRFGAVLLLLHDEFTLCSRIKSIWRGGSAAKLSGQGSSELPIPNISEPALSFQLPKVRTVNYDLN